MLRPASAARTLTHMFSVIIPTLQLSNKLGALLVMYCAHPLVDEVIVINNAQARFPHTDVKLRVLDQERNLYVNPSWNIGARTASSPYLIISNDDISFSPSVIDATARLLRRRAVGIVGPSPKAFSRLDRRPWFVPTYERTTGFGTLMFMNASHFVPIPEDLLVWSGDSWLFDRQAERNYVLMGARIDTEMSTTAGLPEFGSIKHADRATYQSQYSGDGDGGRFKLEALAWRQMRRTGNRYNSLRGRTDR